MTGVIMVDDFSSEAFTRDELLARRLGRLRNPGVDSSRWCRVCWRKGKVVRLVILVLVCGKRKH